MLELSIEIVVAVVVLFAVGMVAVGRGGQLVDVDPDRPPHDLPEGRPMGAADLRVARFSLAFRGYRMAEVDRMLDRLASEIALRDRKLSEVDDGDPWSDDPAAAADPWSQVEGVAPGAVPTVEGVAPGAVPTAEGVTPAPSAVPRVEGAAAGIAPETAPEAVPGAGEEAWQGASSELADVDEIGHGAGYHPGGSDRPDHPGGASRPDHPGGADRTDHPGGADRTDDGQMPEQSRGQRTGEDEVVWPNW